MNKRVLLSLIALVTILPCQASAQTWCYSTYPPDPEALDRCRPSVLWCADLDRLCNGAPSCPPPPLQTCTESQTYSIAQFHALFVRTSSINDGPNLCGVEFKQEDGDAWVSSPPWGTSFRNRQGGLGQATVDLTGSINARFPGYTTIIGTDQHPLILRFDMCGGTSPDVHAKNDIGVMELFLDTAGTPGSKRSPMDYILVGADNGAGCVNCNSLCPEGQSSVQVAWPFVCQSYETRTAAPFCPALQTNVRTAIAVGANALLDSNPCHCENPANQYSTNRYLSFYDGLKWRIINPDHPGPDGETLTWWTDHPNPANSEYFVLGEPTNEVQLFVKTSTVEIHHRTMVNINGQLQWVESRVSGISRKYLGAFSKMHAGASIGCRMESDGSCAGNRTCISEKFTACDGSGTKLWGARWLSFDNLALEGGLPDNADGACCFNATTCYDMLPNDCATAGGAFAGAFTTCSTGSVCQGACCMANNECQDTSFDSCSGTFRGLGTNCSTTGCPCHTPFADADGDQDVDADDFGEFQTCFTGVGPASLSGRCRCFDRDYTSDGFSDVDLDDFAAFLDCATGADVPADPACE